MSYFRVVILQCSAWLNEDEQCPAYIGDDLEAWYYDVTYLRRRACTSYGWWHSRATGDLCPTCYQNWLAEPVEPEGADDGPAE